MRQIYQSLSSLSCFSSIYSFCICLDACIEPTAVLFSYLFSKPFHSIENLLLVRRGILQLLCPTTPLVRMLDMFETFT
ncbi:hypothetical protein BDQ12DRAFT_689272 [Crucibulum laeve]|uniref:Uncharacterized protein n=1 Tax=Crucibulum laeve TaxID=68775 RepID=A0A5C3LQN0_9AGAR|nr:hypothetical protein BDQ12DRAFT_689272 [Crucibulum laeve]